MKYLCQTLQQQGYYMVPKFKTGDIYLLIDGEIIEIIDDRHNLPFIVIQRLVDNAIPLVRNQNLIKDKVDKYLGNNRAAVQVLLGTKR